jgi:hypothetical protein
MDRLRSVARLLIVVADAGILLWGAMAALAPAHLLGPGGAPILPAGYEGSSGGSWSNLGPTARDFMEVLFRVYGAFNMAFGLLAIATAATSFRRGDTWAWWALLVCNTIAFGAAMTYDRTVNAIGPFELSEYLGLAVIYTALAVTSPVFAAGKVRL